MVFLELLLEIIFLKCTSCNYHFPCKAYPIFFLLLKDEKTTDLAYLNVLLFILGHSYYIISSLLPDIC